MLVIPGQSGKDLCDRGLKPSRRQLMQVGGSSMLGLGLAGLLKGQASAATAGCSSNSPGFGRAKSVIMVDLQGGPSHLHHWDG